MKDLYQRVSNIPCLQVWYEDSVIIVDVHECIATNMYRILPAQIRIRCVEISVYSKCLWIFS